MGIHDVTEQHFDVTHFKMPCALEIDKRRSCQLIIILKHLQDQYRFPYPRILLSYLLLCAQKSDAEMYTFRTAESS